MQKIKSEEKFGLLTTKYPINDNEESIQRKEWFCQCDCGKEKIARSWDLRAGIVKSCGCARIKNLISKKFGKLTVLERRENHPRTGDVQWFCQCDCGGKKIATSSHLTSGSIISCGCLIYKGYKEIYGTFFNRIKNSAKSRNIKFDIKIEDIWDLFLKQNRKCALSGLEIKFSSKSDSTDGTASLDRIDSSKGYIKENVQWVHKDINYMKQDNSDEEFIKYCCLVADKSRKFI